MSVECRFSIAADLQLTVLAERAEAVLEKSLQKCTGGPLSSPSSHSSVEQKPIHTHLTARPEGRASAHCTLTRQMLEVGPPSVGR